MPVPESLPLPYKLLLESGPGEAASEVIISSSDDIVSMVNNLDIATKTLEAIATFDGGIAGDEARQALERVGAWSRTS